MLAALVVGGLASAGDAQTITAADYADPTTRYDHGILGDAVEWGTLVLTLSNGTRRRLVLPESRVFEDVAPRLADLDLDGAPEVIAVETDIARGARLSVYDETGLVAATPHIGQTHRWLAPVGAADLDGDGRVEIAYVDRPHLARVLRVWRFEDGALREIAAADGLTNHRIGDPAIAGGLRDCGAGPEMITLDAGWARVMASRLAGGTIETAEVAEAAALQDVLDCKR
ncbi:FG-GAP repeat domain-containing protein [Anianabacter salinae]|uniref:FG-GAP repeat domain-containing protein n=1 Tax=Anianabacter salinae TaxID=2851023 RepID=UPI00225E6F86|nr:VCBS repeat-containing protein [Anianabacter salinae]